MGVGCTRFIFQPFEQYVLVISYFTVGKQKMDQNSVTINSSARVTFE